MVQGPVVEAVLHQKGTNPLILERPAPYQSLSIGDDLTCRPSKKQIFRSQKNTSIKEATHSVPREDQRGCFFKLLNPYF